MPLLSPGSGRGRYIVRSEEPKHLADFIDKAQSDPDLELVDLIGPAGAPHTAVFVIPHEKAAVLEQEFGQSPTPLIIERDRPLSLFENGGD